jgi:crossover junction endodeoxyribonuclease RuvC
MKERIIIGIDPGTNVMGYGVIKINQSKVELLDLGVINLSKFDDHAIKLKMIFKECTSLLEKHLPDEMAIEAPFYGKNVQSMLKLGRAQGVAIAAAVSREIPVKEYSPRKIKQSITGNGNASKEQVSAMIKHLVTNAVVIPDDVLNDATDAVAVALCHFYQEKSVGASKQSKNWADFIKNNPGRASS